MAYSMQQLWIPGAFVVENKDEVFGNYFFLNQYDTADAMMVALHESDKIIRNELA